MLKATWISNTFFGRFLKGEQIHGLLVQFVHSLLAIFRGRLKHGGNHALDFGSLLGAQGQHREDRRRRDARPRPDPAATRAARGWPVWRSIHGERTEAPGSSSRAPGEIDDGVAEVARDFPVVARGAGSDAKKAKSTRSNCSERMLWIKFISSPTASSRPSDSSSSSRRTSTAGKFRSRRISATSFPRSEAAPTMATR